MCGIGEQLIARGSTGFIALRNGLAKGMTHNTFTETMFFLSHAVAAAAEFQPFCPGYVSQLSGRQEQLAMPQRKPVCTTVGEVVKSF